MKLLKSSILMLAIFSISLFACKKETLTPVCDGGTPTYDDNIKAIIDASCMGNSCHGSGSKRGDYTSYAGLESSLTDGSFKKEVLVDQTMPRFDNLTQAELNTIQCWMENGYPEK